MTAVLWLRNDLRLNDNPALNHALTHHEKIICLYIHDTSSPYPMGGATRWWLHHSLSSLKKDIEAKGGHLILKTGTPESILEEIIKDHGVTGVYWNRRYEPLHIQSDTKIKESLHHRGITVQTFNSHLLFEPWEIKTLQQKPFQVFTPFWKSCLTSQKSHGIVSIPEKIPSSKIDGVTLESLGLLPQHPDWAEGLRQEWTPGEDGAQERAQNFFEHALKNYKDNRNVPGLQGTSKLSPHLHFGEISPRQLWHKAHQLLAQDASLEKGATTFLSELGWREFSHHLLYHFPTIVDEPLRREFTRFPWESNQDHLHAWQRGLTGYPIVDAAMRELWQTGWMHNRTRMIAGSFLIKDLLIHWKEGADWFWDTLVDADLANNSASWQWVAGCGADAAPYFRIFNPVLQGQKFDPNGHYVRKFVPELAQLPNQYIHTPWEAPVHILKQAGVILGQTYPRPIVDHKHCRDEALKRFKGLKENAGD